MIWIPVKESMPKENIGVLVFIPKEDNHITSGMWDISKKWVLLDDYRVPECEVTHWMPLPPNPHSSFEEFAAYIKTFDFKTERRNYIGPTKQTWEQQWAHLNRPLM